MTRSLIASVAVAIIALGCTKERRDPPLSSSGGGPSGPATLSTIQSDIFLFSCAVSGCHDNRANPAANLGMASVQDTYANLVGRASTQVPTRALVAAGDADNSYLIDKLFGTHIAVGGTGVYMPQYAARLTDAEIERVVIWINDGAQLN